MSYADQPTAGSACDIEPSPNGNDADATLNVTSHEHNEAITDPLGTAWYDSVGYEVGDKCAWTFGTQQGSTPHGAYNQAIGSGVYELQQEWSNLLSGCVLNAIVLPPQITSYSPGKGRAGTTITLAGKNLLGASQVTLRSVPATFTVVSPTKITARVPAGVSGLASWTVKTPGGSASSSQLFCALLSRLRSEYPPFGTRPDSTAAARGRLGFLGCFLRPFSRKVSPSDEATAHLRRAARARLHGGARRQPPVGQAGRLPRSRRTSAGSCR